MKKITVVLILTVLLFSTFACGEQESPPAYLPSIKYNGMIISHYTVTLNKENDRTPEEIIKADKDKIDFVAIEGGKITLENGSDKNADFAIDFNGVYTENGEKTEYRESDLSSLPSGKYVICAGIVKKMKERTDNLYIFAGIEK